MRWLATQSNKTDITKSIIDKFPEFATMLGIPEIAALLEKASLPENDWTPQYFQSQLWNTKWWKETPESSRTWQARKLVDPATSGQQSHAMVANVVATGTSLGLSLSAGEVAWYTEYALAEGWDQTALTRAMVDTHKQKRFHAGTVTSAQQGLHATASNYGVKISEANAFHWATQIATGRQTQDGFEAWARNQAKAAFPQLTKELEAGLTVKQVADPYTMSITDPKWQRALQGRDAKGQPTGPMNTQDWSRHIMQDPQYGYDRSSHGQSAALDLRNSLAKTFGMEG
jgi:hypothetical protein